MKKLGVMLRDQGDKIDGDLAHYPFETLLREKRCGALWTGLLALISRAYSYHNFSLWHHEFKLSAALVVLN